jgi:hypothetical protein
MNIMAMGLIFFLLAGINLRAQINWEKYSSPVLTGTSWSEKAAVPVVIFEQDTFKMWFASNDRIAYAKSIDGINWITNNNPVFPDGSPGAWDEGRYPGTVLRVNDTLKMWYSGSSDGFNFEISIGYAWSMDNITWNILPDSVLANGEPGTWDETGVFQPVVYYDGSIYHMWYSGFEGTSWWDPMMEGYATSTDGINWTKYPDPVLTLGEDGSFYDVWVVGTSILFFENEFHMWFAGWDGTSTSPFRYWRIGYATSPDGVTWTVENDNEPVVDVGESGTWDDIWARYCSVLIHEDHLKMWYDGKGDELNIGYALGDSVNVGIPEQYVSKGITISPNPFRDFIIITYKLNERSQIWLEILNYQGKKITTLVDGNLQQGEQNVTFDGASLPSGIYFCVLKTNEGIQTTKMIKVK